MGRQAVSPSSFASDCYLGYGLHQVDPIHIKEKRGEALLEGSESFTRYVSSHTRQPRFSEMATFEQQAAASTAQMLVEKISLKQGRHHILLPA